MVGREIGNVGLVGGGASSYSRFSLSGEFTFSARTSWAVVCADRGALGVVFGFWVIFALAVVVGAEAGLAGVMEGQEEGVEAGEEVTDRGLEDSGGKGVIGHDDRT